MFLRAHTLLELTLSPPFLPRRHEDDGSDLVGCACTSQVYVDFEVCGWAMRLSSCCL
ncbi:uncharacterized protein DS421_5g140010 [Arachis hypogaea]|nr:uncharacterized protein DS421_5g140010 [Arachis hypogaea]